MRRGMNLIGKLQPVIILAAAFCAWFWVRSRPLARCPDCSGKTNM